MHLRQLLEDPTARSILNDRARALALQEEGASEQSGAANLIFLLGGSGYALPAGAVREVQPLGAYTALPAVPGFIVGLVNVRGRLLAAIDLRPLLGLASETPAPDALLLIISADGGEVGLVADSVEAISHSPGELSPAPSTGPGRSPAWIRGVDAELTLHLSPELLLADPSIIVNAEAEVS